MDSPPENKVNSFDSSLPTVFPDPPTMELPSLDVFTLDPPGFNPQRLDPPRPDPPAPEPAKTSSKRTSIFQKSGSILRNPVSFNTLFALDLCFQCQYCHYNDIQTLIFSSSFISHSLGERMYKEETIRNNVHYSEAHHQSLYPLTWFDNTVRCELQI